MTINSPLYLHPKYIIRNLIPQQHYRFSFMVVQANSGEMPQLIADQLNKYTIQKANIPRSDINVIGKSC